MVSGSVVVGRAGIEVVGDSEVAIVPDVVTLVVSEISAIIVCWDNKMGFKLCAIGRPLFIKIAFLE